MVKAWYMDTTEGDCREEHRCTPDRPVPLDQLEKKTGVAYYKIPMGSQYTEGYDKASLDAIREERGYSYEDEISISEKTLPNYHEKLKIFFTEHLHSDEEIRFCKEGSGYFDVRDPNEEWIRISLEPGDLIILPAGIYHRFTLDSSNYILAKRYFVGEPVWTPHNRPADDHPARHSYLTNFPVAASS